jgi:serine/threonine protein kinase
MGEVYRAKDTRLDRVVAVKVLPSQVADNPEKRQRFEREARSISTLSHPHICTLHDIGRQDGVDYLVLEYLEGETLEKKLEKGSLPMPDAPEVLSWPAEWHGRRRELQLYNLASDVRRVKVPVVGCLTQQRRVIRAREARRERTKGPSPLVWG